MKHAETGCNVLAVCPPFTELRKKVRQMNDTKQEETLLLKQCGNCSSSLPAAHRFCRWCGTSQIANLPVSATSRELGKPASVESEAHNSHASGYVSVSALLVSSMMQCARAVRTGRHDCRIATRLIGVLIFVPLWIMIVMVSPFEAYFVSKSLVR